jgi:hypothetical protein
MGNLRYCSSVNEQKQHLSARYAVTPPGKGGRYEADWDWERRAQTQLNYAAERYLIGHAQLLRTAGLQITFEVTSGGASRVHRRYRSEPAGGADRDGDAQPSFELALGKSQPFALTLEVGASEAM